MRKIFMAASAALLVASQAGAQQLIVNGGFETPGLFGWSTSNGGSGSVNDSPAGGTPFAAYAGSHFAFTQQGGPGVHELYQNFTLSGAASAATLSFVLRNQTDASTSLDGGSLSYSGAANQHVTVDLFSGSYSAFATSGALANFFQGGQAELGGNVWKTFSFDVTSLLNAPGNYYLRFAEVDNQNYSTMGVDEVSLDASTAPEPASLVLIGTGLLGVAGVARRRRKSA